MSAQPPDWAALLVDAVTKPGVISNAYSRFWNYSIGNQLLAMFQCMLRRIEPGPLNTFLRWKELGRSVRKGERAITLCMPVTIKRRRNGNAIDVDAVRIGDGAERQLASCDDAAADDDGRITFTRFTYKPHWFVLSQTEGVDYLPTELPEWREGQALHTLFIDRIRFDHPNGNCQGYATGREVSVSPLAGLPHKTLFHELAHVVLGHTEEGSQLDDHDRTPVNLREVEAESVALICCESLNLNGSAECRGYIQHWLGMEKIPARNAQRIFKAADTILKAGYPVPKPSESPIALA